MVVRIKPSSNWCATFTSKNFMVAFLTPFFPHGANSLVGQHLLRVHDRIQLDTPESAGLLWMSDQADAGTSA